MSHGGHFVGRCGQADIGWAMSVAVSRLDSSGGDPWKDRWVALSVTTSRYVATVAKLVLSR